MPKVFFISLLMFSLSSYASITDYLLEYREAGFLYYCDVNDSAYEKSLCNEHYDKAHTQDLIRISNTKREIKVDVLIHWGRGRQSGSSAYGFYNDSKDFITLNRFEGDEWSRDEDLDSRNFIRNPCTLHITRDKNLLTFRLASKSKCELPSSFEMLLRSQMKIRANLR